MGIAYLFLSLLFFTTMAIGVKFLPNIPFYEIIFFRSIISTGCCYWVLRKKNITVFKLHPAMKLLLARGIIGTFGLCCFFFVLKNLSMAYAVTLHQLAPLFIVAISVFFLKQKVHLLQLCGALAAVLGIVWTYQVNIDDIDWLVSIGILGAFCSAITFHIIYALRGKADPSLIIIYFPLTSIPVAATFFLFNAWITPSLFELMLLIGIGFTTHIAQFFLTLAYQHEEPSKLSMYAPISVIFAALISVMIFQEVLNFNQWAGISFIFLGVIISSVGNYIIKRGPAKAIPAEIP